MSAPPVVLGGLAVFEEPEPLSDAVKRAMEGRRRARAALDRHRSRMLADWDVVTPAGLLRRIADGVALSSTAERDWERWTALERVYHRACERVSEAAR